MCPLACQYGWTIPRPVSTDDESNGMSAATDSLHRYLYPLIFFWSFFNYFFFGIFPFKLGSLFRRLGLSQGLSDRWTSLSSEFNSSSSERRFFGFGCGKPFSRFEFIENVPFACWMDGAERIGEWVKWPCNKNVVSRHKSSNQETRMPVSPDDWNLNHNILWYPPMPMKPWWCPRTRVGNFSSPSSNIHANRTAICRWAFVFVQQIQTKFMEFVRRYYCLLNQNEEEAVLKASQST